MTRGCSLLWLATLGFVIALGGCSESDAPEEVAPDMAPADMGSVDPPDGAHSDAEVPDAAPIDAGPSDAAPDAAALPQVDDLRDLPVDAAGPFAVGYRTWETSYPVPGTGELRTIPVHVWYPARAVDGQRPLVYLGYRDEISVLDAPAAPPVGERYPVHVYSHGDQAFGGNLWWLMGLMASHGWVGVAPDHVGNMLVDNTRGESVAHFIERPADISAALDALAALPEDDLLSRAGVEQALLSGHSRGTYTVWAGAGATFDLDAIAEGRPDATDIERGAFGAGLGDARVVAAIGLDGAYRTGYFGDAGFAAVEVPLLFLSGDDRVDSMQAMFDRMEGLELLWGSIEGACHESFTVLGVNCPSLELALAHQVIGTYALAFGRRHVLGDEGPGVIGLLDGAIELSPRVTLRRR